MTDPRLVSLAEGVGRGLALTADVLESITRRIILEAFQESSASWWDHRAVQFDRVGTVTGDETADLCRTHAGLLRELGVPDAATDLAAAIEGLAGGRFVIEDAAEDATSQRPPAALETVGGGIPDQ